MRIARVMRVNDLEKNNNKKKRKRDVEREDK
jgi:hypothetical protein